LHSRSLRLHSPLWPCGIYSSGSDASGKMESVSSLPSCMLRAAAAQFACRRTDSPMFTDLLTQIQTQVPPTLAGLAILAAPYPAHCCPSCMMPLLVSQGIGRMSTDVPLRSFSVPGLSPLEETSVSTCEAGDTPSDLEARNLVRSRCRQSFRASEMSHQECFRVRLGSTRPLRFLCLA